MTPEQKQELVSAVREIVMHIPRGRATSYGAIARAAGWPLHSRMVGRVMAGSEGLPAHRVVGSAGVLTGHTARMRTLLEAEGVAVANNKITDWRRVLWDPMEEL